MRIHSEWLGRSIMVEIDRPAGSTHPGNADIVYPIHYGFIPGTRADDGHAVDVYVLDDPSSIDPARPFEVIIVGIVHRKEDGQDKLVATTSGTPLSEETLYDAIAFQEQWFKHTLEVLRAPL